MSFAQFFVFEKKILFELSYPGLQHKLLKTEMEMVEFRQRYIQEKSRRMTLHNTLVVSNCVTTVSRHIDVEVSCQTLFPTKVALVSVLYQAMLFFLKL